MAPATLLTTSQERRNRGASQSERAYQILKEKIITLELPPASVLNEANLMAELRLGRTPIREALRQLAFENLVVILPRRGTIVADLNASDLQKIFEVRLELEVMAARLAAERITDKQVAELEALFIEADEIIQRGDQRELIALDYRVHRLLARAARNEFLEEILERLYTHVMRLWYVSLHQVDRLAEAVAEHRALIAAVKAGDGALAASLMHAHVAGFQAAFTAAW